MAKTTATFGDKAKVLGRVLRVGTSVMFERTTGMKAVKAGDVPPSAACMTPEWLTAVLCAVSPGARVLDYRVTGGSSGSSMRAGIELTLNDEARRAGVPDRLFTKSSSTFVQRMFMGLAGSWGEIIFFTKIRPELEIETPRGYHGCKDEASWRSMILMEDTVVTKGAKFISTETYIDRARMEDLLGDMAHWHGRFWSSPRFRGDLSSLRTPAGFLADLGKFISLKERAMLAMEKYSHLVPNDILRLGDELWEATVKSFQINLGMPQTLLHGDPHIGNCYITGAGKMGFADWQGVQRGGWAADFSYGLISALTIEDRRAWEHDLLRFYLDRLHAAGGPRIDFDSAWLAYRQHLHYPYIAWAFTRYGASARLPEFQSEQACNDIMTRTAHAVSDLDAIDAVNRH